VFVRFGILVTVQQRQGCQAPLQQEDTSLGTKVIQAGTYLFLCISCCRAMSDTVAYPV